MFDFLRDKKFLKSAFLIAIPVALQNIINTGINFVDTLMVATLDANSVAAVGLGNNVFYFWNTFSFGIISGGMVLCSQFYGAKKDNLLRRTYGLTIIIDFIASMFFFLPCRLFSRNVFSLLTSSSAIVDIGSKYLKIVCFMYPIQSVTLTTLLILRSFGKVRITVFSSLATMLTNILLNYLLINGHFGFPALGVEGAAIATIVSRLLEAIILVVYLFVSRSVLVKKMSDLFSFLNWEYLLLYFKTSIVIIIDEFVFGLGTSLYLVAYGRLPEAQVSAATIIWVVYDLLLVFFIGLGSACSVILGMELGKGNIDKAKTYARYFIKLYTLFNIVVALFTYCCRGLVCSFYANLGSEVTYYIDLLMIVTAVFILIGNYGHLFTVGILRSGGDIGVTIVIDLLTCWCISVPLSFISVLVWKQPVHIAYLCLLPELLIREILGYIRYRKFKWANNMVVGVD